MIPTLSDARSPHRSVLDVAILLSVPVVLIVLFHLPLEIRHSLRLSYTDPALHTAFISHFIHADPLHLLINLVGYVICTGLTYACCVLAGRRRHFFVVFATILVVFPLVFSVLNLLPNRPGVSYGFSGILMAFVGFLPLSIAWYAGRWLDRHITSIHGFLLYSTGQAFVVLVHLPAVTSLRTLVLIPLGAGILTAPSISVRTVITNTSRHLGALELGLVSVIVYLVLLVTAFPVESVWHGSIVNIYLHAIGFTCGFLVPFMGFGIHDVLRGFDPISRVNHVPIDRAYPNEH